MGHKTHNIQVGKKESTQTERRGVLEQTDEQIACGLVVQQAGSWVSIILQLYCTQISWENRQRFQTYVPPQNSFDTFSTLVSSLLPTDTTNTSLG